MLKILQFAPLILLPYMPFSVKSSDGDIENSITEQVISLISQHVNEIKAGIFYGISTGLTIIVFVEQFYADEIIEFRYGNRGRFFLHVSFILGSGITGAAVAVAKPKRD